MTLLRKSMALFSCLTALIAINGCTGFHKKFHPDTVEWARAQGNTTIMVHGYKTGTNSVKTPCLNIPQKASLVPDDPYFRDWIAVLGSAWPLKASLSDRANAFVRHAPRQSHCVFTFNNVPAGQWLIVFIMNAEVAYGVGPRPSRSTTFYRVYSPITVAPTDTLIRKDMKMDSTKSRYVTVGFLSFPALMNQTDLIEWTGPELLPHTNQP